ncbi:MAG TPA: hypothetical protein PKO06_24780, partial [Candidatus Ozemobacteraceae bacterium]|nr:hypothetical protein [Candidatus Ozemobacteraceae bacterium]
MKMRLLLVIWMVLGLVSVGWSGPANSAHIAENAVWVGHAGVEKMCALPLVAECPFMSGTETKSARHLQAFIEKTGLDPRKDVRAVTAWATQYEGDVGVMIIYAQHVDRARLVAFLREKRSEVKEETVSGYDLYTWNMRYMRKQLEVTGTFVDDQTILVG